MNFTIHRGDGRLRDKGHEGVAESDQTSSPIAPRVGHLHNAHLGSSSARAHVMAMRHPANVHSTSRSAPVRSAGHEGPTRPLDPGIRLMSTHHHPKGGGGSTRQVEGL